jgi:DnaJ like chaperone protein
MAKFGKWVGAGLGWVLGGGPIGAIIGLSLGWMLDSASQSDVEKGHANTTVGDFVVSLLILMAAVMKADGKVLRSELDYVKKYLVSRFGEESAAEALKMLRDILKQNIPLQETISITLPGLNYCIFYTGLLFPTKGSINRN